MDVPVPGVVVGRGGAVGERTAGDRVQAVSNRDHARLEVIDVSELADLRIHATPSFNAVDAAGFDQEPVADWRAPVHGDEALEREAAIHAGLW